mmetsp:Transcript_1687/g.2359  ORF Transcript_1687/g.2359 Transcript_1687/m.2359 type:complete len:445 (-) Transcript_1687:104-1438(-)
MAAREWPADPTKYVIRDTIGHGAFGTVFRAEVKQQWEPVAVKIVDLEERGVIEAWREVRIMGLLSHKNIVRHHVAFTSENHLWIVLPLFNLGSCKDVFQKVYPSGIKSNRLIATILKSIVEALAVIHANRIAHKDIKAENILIDSKGRVGLSDFGIACEIDCRGEGLRFEGTLQYMPPEIVRGTSTNLSAVPSLRGSQLFDGVSEEKSRSVVATASQNGSVSSMTKKLVDASYNAQRADIWSLGITALQLGFGKPPYDGEETIKVTKRIMGDAPPTASYFGDTSYKFARSYHDFVASCLEKVPDKRPTAKQMLLHKFIRKYSRDQRFVRNKLITLLNSTEKTVKKVLKKSADTNTDEQKSHHESMRKRKETKRKSADLLLQNLRESIVESKGTRKECNDRVDEHTRNDSVSTRYTHSEYQFSRFSRTATVGNRRQSVSSAVARQ